MFRIYIGRFGEVRPNFICLKRNVLNVFL